MKCLRLSHVFKVSSLSEIELQFSKDRGVTWSRVLDDCTPSDVTCVDETAASVYASDEFDQWRRVIVRLPENTRSEILLEKFISLRSRYVQENKTLILKFCFTLLKYYRQFMC